MWYRVQWLEENSLLSVREEYLQAVNIERALREAADRWEVGGSCSVYKVAGPPGPSPVK